MYHIFDRTNYFYLRTPPSFEGYFLLAFRAHPTRDCGGGKELLDRQINRIQQQMATLQSLEQQLIALRRQCGDPQQADDCRILKNLGETQSCGDHE